MPANEKLETGTREFDYLKLRREVLSKEIDYRREKTWRIFSWSSSILLATLGAIIALSSKGFRLGWSQRIPAALAIFIVSSYSHIWITQNLKQAKVLQKAIREHDAELGIELIENEHTIPLGYRVSMLIIAVITILVIIFVGERPA
ncbi:MAG: hypothetical protein DMF68_14815 [Acidobacteria bacterium]|nr:MAG: hypothetical protein DMF68_14815 [Acidobacteriota bacterium]